MTTEAPSTVHSGEIYFALAPHALYVTRGWTEAPAITLAEWLEVVEAHPDLRLCEPYRQHNIDRGVRETWRELGRARWSELPADEYLHYAPAGIRYLHGPSYRGGRAATRWQALRRALGENPTLSAWLDYVARDRFLEAADRPDSPERGRARWLDRRGAAKHLFRFQPASVWMYRSRDVCVASLPARAPEIGRLRMAWSLAGQLDAGVLDGAEYFALTNA